MKQAAKELAFEQAAVLRDQILDLRKLLAEESNLPPWQKARLMAGEID
jgi:excinuclease ABC subunit B